MRFAVGLESVDFGLWGDTYGRYSVSSMELKSRIDDPLCGMLVGVLSLGAPA